jgi:hypothetical protein
MNPAGFWTLVALLVGMFATTALAWGILVVEAVKKMR